MEAICVVLAGIVCLFLFYKVLSSAVRLFIMVAIAGTIIAGIARLFGDKASEARFDIGIDTTVVSDISSSSCYYATETCISDAIKQDGRIVIVIIESPYCLMCRVNKLLLVYNRKFADIAMENGVELIFDSLENIGETYPESLRGLVGRPPFNVIFSEANPFGRSINRFLTHGYMELQIQDEVAMCRLLSRARKSDDRIDGRIDLRNGSAHSSVAKINQKGLVRHKNEDTSVASKGSIVGHKGRNHEVLARGAKGRS